MGCHLTHTHREERGVLMHVNIDYNQSKLILGGIAYLTERVRIILTALINQNMNGVLLTDVIFLPTEAAAAQMINLLLNWY